MACQTKKTSWISSRDGSLSPDIESATANMTMSLDDLMAHLIGPTFKGKLVRKTTSTPMPPTKKSHQLGVSPHDEGAWISSQDGSLSPDIESATANMTMSLDDLMAHLIGPTSKGKLVRKTTSTPMPPAKKSHQLGVSPHDKGASKAQAQSPCTSGYFNAEIAEAHVSSHSVKCSVRSLILDIVLQKAASIACQTNMTALSASRNGSLSPDITAATANMAMSLDDLMAHLTAPIALTPKADLVRKTTSTSLPETKKARQLNASTNVKHATPSLPPPSTTTVIPISNDGYSCAPSATANILQYALGPYADSLYLIPDHSPANHTLATSAIRNFASMLLGAPSSYSPRSIVVNLRQHVLENSTAHNTYHDANELLPIVLEAIVGTSTRPWANKRTETVTCLHGHVKALPFVHNFIPLLIPLKDHNAVSIHLSTLLTADSALSDVYSGCEGCHSPTAQACALLPPIEPRDIDVHSKCSGCTRCRPLKHKQDSILYNSLAIFAIGRQHTNGITHVETVAETHVQLPQTLMLANQDTGQLEPYRRLAGVFFAGQHYIAMCGDICYNGTNVMAKPSIWHTHDQLCTTVIYQRLNDCPMLPLSDVIPGSSVHTPIKPSSTYYPPNNYDDTDSEDEMTLGKLSDLPTVDNLQQACVNQTQQRNLLDFAGSFKAQPGIKSTNLTMPQFYKGRLYERRGDFNVLLHGSALSDQMMIDSFIRCEDAQLEAFRNNQDRIKGASKSQLLKRADQLRSGGDGSVDKSWGQRVVIPASHPGSAAAKMQLFKNAMAVVESLGKPQLFITMTANPSAIEIVHGTAARTNSSGCTDIVARVFRRKVKDLLALIKSGRAFGAYSYCFGSIE